MNLRTICRLTLFVLIGFTPLMPTFAEQAQSGPTSIRVGLLPSGLPLFGQDQNNQFIGIYMDIVGELAQRLGVSVAYDVLPHKRMVSALMQDHLDLGLYFRSRIVANTPPPGIQCLSPAMVSLDVSIFTHAGTPETPPRVGLIYPGEDRKLSAVMTRLGIPDYRYYHLATISAMFKSLASRRIDYAFSSTLGAEFWESRLNAKFVPAFTIDTAEILMCFHQNHLDSAFQARLSEAFAQLIGGNFVDQVKGKYINPSPLMQFKEWVPSPEDMLGHP